MSLVIRLVFWALVVKHGPFSNIEQRTDLDLATNVFWRQVRNFIIDLTAIPASSSATGIHWPTAQATSLQNIVFKMSQASGTQHQGIFIESGQELSSNHKDKLRSTLLTTQRLWRIYDRSCILRRPQRCCLRQSTIHSAVRANRSFLEDDR